MVPLPSVAKDIPVAQTKKNTSANSVKAMYTVEDQLADEDVVGLLSSPYTNDNAHAYLMRDVPLRSHSIWTSLVAWTNSNVKLVTPADEQRKSDKHGFTSR